MTTHKPLTATSQKVKPEGQNSTRSDSLVLWLALGATVAGVALMLGGCSVLPTNTNSTRLPWKDYDSAKNAFAQVKPNATARSELEALGFNPTTLANTQVLNYVDVVNLFGASFRLDDLPEGIRACVNARELCQAYVVRGQNIENKRTGFVPADLLGFRKKVHTTGWEFAATLVLVNDTVTYKLWKGTPNVDSTSNESNPLGPMQSLEGAVPSPF